MSVTVRVAASTDTAMLARLRWTWRVDEENEPAVGEFDAFISALEQWCATHPDHVAFLAMDGGAGPVPIGTARLQSVYVLPDRRGAGVGSVFLAASEREARRQGCAYIAVHPSRRCMRLYERAGYRVSSGLLELRFDDKVASPTDRTIDRAAH